MTDPIAGEELRRIFQTLPGVAMMILRADGTYDYVNDAFASMYGASGDRPLVGRRMSEFFHPDFVTERLELFARALETGKPLVVDHLYRGRPLSATIFPLGDDEGPGRVVVVSRHASPHDPPVTEFERVRSRFMDLGPLAKLSQRELEVFVLLGHGMSVPEVAARLKRSPKTIEQHKAAIGRKLGDSTLAGIARAVAEIGIDEEHLRATAIDVFQVDRGESQENSHGNGH